MKKIYSVFILALLAFTVCLPLQSQSTDVGAIPGEFSVSALGGAVYTVPIECPAGINGMQPTLAVSYNSLAGDGALGIGWNLEGVSSITRVPRSLFNGDVTRGITYQYNDDYALDGNRLILTSQLDEENGALYQTEVENFHHIQSFGIILEDFEDTGPSYFKVTAKDGRVIEYGNTDDSRFVPGGGLYKAPYMWLINKVTDQNGNYITYHYNKSSGTVRLDKIVYGNYNTTVTTEIIFLAMLRYVGPRVSYVSGRSIINDFVYTSIGIKNNGEIIYSYEFDYDTQAGGSKFFLSDIKKRMSDNSYFPSPTTINWGGYNTNLEKTSVGISTFDDPTDGKYNFIACDINGDGKDDLIACYTVNGNNYMEKLINYDEYFNKNEKPANIGVNIGFDSQTQFQNSNMLLADVNADGINEFISSSFMKINGICNFKIGAHGERATDMRGNSFRLDNSENAPAFVCGDFNNDGYDDLLLIEDQKGNLEYPAKMICFKDGGTRFYEKSLFFKLSGVAKQIYASDFDNDGLIDLFILTDKSCHFFKNNGGAESWGETYLSFFEVGKQNNFSFNSGCKAVRCGDFNGDGLLDFLLNGMINGNYCWYLALSNGNFEFDATLVSQFSMVNDQSSKDCVVMDFNHDGRSDVIMVDLINENGQVKTRIDWWESEGSDFSLKSRYDQNKTFNNSNCVGDFNGDGWPDLFSFHSSLLSEEKNNTSYIANCTNTNFCSEKVDLITDGMEKETRMEYRPLSYPKNDDGSVYYSKKARTANTYCNIQPPLICVSNYRELAFSDVIADVSYSYADLAYGVRKKSLYGFTGVTVTDNLMKTQKETSVTWAYDYGLPLGQVDVVRTTDQIPVSRSESANGITYDGHFYLLLSSVTTTDYLKDITRSVSYGYDICGNILRQTTKCTGMEEKQLMEYTDAGSWCKNRLSRVAVSRNDSSEVHTRTTDYEYDDKGNLLKEIRDPLDEKKLVTQYSDFTAFGLPQKVTVTAGGVSRTSTSVYTPSGRFVSGTTNELGETTVYNWDETFMQKNSETSVYGTTAYTYDNWRRLTKVTAPDGVKTDYSIYRASGGGPDNAFYFKTEQTDGQSPLKVWYDCLGREIKSEFYGLNNKKICTDTEYDELGRLYRSSRPYFESESPVWEKTCTYDSYGRPSTVVTPLGTTSYTYGGLTTDVTTPQGSMQTVLNASGQTVRQTTDGKAVDYTYYASGLTKTATPQGGSSVSMEYDLQGNRTKLIDPDGGTITSVYDAFGQVLEESQLVHKMVLESWPSAEAGAGQADEVGQGEAESKAPVPMGTVTTSYTYRSTGLLEKIKRGGESTEYVYDTRNRVRRVSKFGPSSTFLSYRLFEYDNFDRITKNTQAIGTEKTMVTRQTYDAYGRLQSLTYPSGYKIGYDYDANGKMIQIRSDHDMMTHILWKALDENALGQITREQKGANVVTYEYNSLGNLTYIDFPAAVRMSYTYNDKGNLSKREDLLTDYREIFTYDDQNRLDYWRVSRGNLISFGNSMSYDASTGNITSKSDVDYTFSYGEKSAGPHALTSISGKPSLVPDNPQKITYTDFKKVKKLTEGSKSLEITYGVDEQRCKEVQTVDGVTTTRYFDENHEEIISDGVGREFNYVSSPSGLVAVVCANTYLASSRVVSDYIKIYHAQTDYQGSLLALVSEKGAVEKYAYDPWGRRRNPQNWHQPDTRTGFIIDRGYTMHQHLGAFGLINMNGRMYDPALAMFLSPDPFIQAPDNWLNYNRYSYCLNNPMMYTDPSGEFFVLDDWIIGGFKGLFNGEGFFKSANRHAINSAKIWGGLFTSDSNKSFWGKAWEVVSRFTWQFLQTTAGLVASHTYNTFGNVRDVSYKYGATVLRTNSSPKSMGAITLGSYIIGNREISADANNVWFQHEYGHYLQSQEMGLGYLSRVGIPSLISASKKGNMHNYRSFEQDANKRAFKYFNKNVPGFYKSREDWDDTSYGWQFKKNPLVKKGSRDYYIDYNNSDDMNKIASLSISAKWYDFILGSQAFPLGIIGVGLYNWFSFK